MLGQDIAAMKRLEAKIARKQKNLARKKKLSKNCIKNKTKISKLHRKAVNIRHDFLHKATTYLAKNHGLVVLEDLKVKNMTASAAGTMEEPGKMIAQKSSLNRAILRHGWGIFHQQLAYKCVWYGSELRTVPSAYTSQACFVCDHCEAGNRNDEAFKCLGCGHEDHADINAAKNILKLGLDKPEVTPGEMSRKRRRRTRNLELVA
jgi:putative transposase